MFSLFICVTQDGWLTIADEFRVCGHNILGPIYLVVYITLGAFVFANLVVAVVVTNLVGGSEGWSWQTNKDRSFPERGCRSSYPPIRK